MSTQALQRQGGTEQYFVTIKDSSTGEWKKYDISPPKDIWGQLSPDSFYDHYRDPQKE